MKFFKILMVMGVLAFGTVANASPVIFEFDGAGGNELVLNEDGSIVGSGINIDSIFVTDAVGVRTEYQVDLGFLSFNTADGPFGTLSIDGSVDSILGTSTGQVNIFSGNVIGGFNYDESTGFNVFTGTGGGTVNADILSILGLPVDGFSYFAFTLGYDNVGTITTDITATQNPKGLEPPAVPVPAAAWLFGSGLLGMIGVARRKA